MDVAPDHATEAGPAAESERLRRENETLSAVVGLVGSSPDLGHVLDRVVDLLTQVSGCHACFVYLVAGDRLKLRAASPVYGRHVGRIEFGVDEGLAGWSVRHKQAAVIQDRAMDDPRTNFVPELEEERFQSIAAVPVPSRSGEILGVIVLHTAAPHEFDESTLKVLPQTASLIAGAIENAKLYEEAQHRVEALTRLSRLSQRIAAVTRRADLYRVATSGIRGVLPCDDCRLLELDPGGRLVIVAADPPQGATIGAYDGTAEVLLEMLQSSPSETLRLRTVVGRVLGRDQPPEAALAVPVAAGPELLGALVVGAHEPWHEHAEDLLRAVAHQIAVALKKAEVIESLSEENTARELFGALEDERWDIAEARAHTLSCDLTMPHVMVEARPVGATMFQPGEEGRLERALRQAKPGTVCDADGRRLRALIPARTAGAEAARAVSTGLDAIGREHGVALGVSTARRGPAGARATLGEARDAAAVALALLDGGGVLPYGDMGAYRYLVGLLETGGPDDELRTAVERLVEYDAVRHTQLLTTLELFLSNGRSSTTTSRALMVHVNTLRQRLERIESLTGLHLDSQDLLALQLAIKVAHLRRSPGDLSESAPRGHGHDDHH
jgi:GAF domain-containing protein